MNALVGERMSIITSKPQTTRHRILGIVSGEDYQLVFSDTPGIIKEPNYKMQEAMNKFIATAFEDADIMVFLAEIGDEFPVGLPFLKKLESLEIPVFLVINKIDKAKAQDVLEMIKSWNQHFSFTETIPVSALKGDGVTLLKETILKYTPEGPAYYDKDQFTDRPERFFVNEIIREQILKLYEQEIPYSCEVETESFKESETKKGEKIIRIFANIYVNRKSQKAIIIGKEGKGIRKLGTAARKDLEKFFQQKIFLEFNVKVREGWRDNENTLKRFGYQ